MRFETKEEKEKFITITYKDNEKVCECQIDIDKDSNVWTISSWYTMEGYKHKGYGTQTLQVCLCEINKKLGLPSKVEYIWNGANEYVFEWLNGHFGAVSKCPIAVQKYSFEDDWESHIYVLNKYKFIEYFSLKER